MNNQIIISDDLSFKDIIAKLHVNNIKRVFIVAGINSFSASGAERKLLPILDEQFDVNIYKASPKVLTTDDIDSCIDFMKVYMPDAVIAVGGGSIIDMAKVAMAGIADDCDAGALISNKSLLLRNMPLFVAIPTTAGSGSESTHFAVMYKDGIKYSVANDKLLPAIVLLEPEFIMSVPKKIAIAASLDAFAQAIESFWSVNSTEESLEYSKQALRLLVADMLSAIEQGNLESYANVQRAANFAGRAINITKTTASHALSYPLTVHYGVLHGVAVFLTLSAVFRFNAAVTEDDYCDIRGVEYVRKMLLDLATILGYDTIEAAAKSLDDLLLRLGCRNKLNEYGIIKADIMDVILSEVNVERMKNNPRMIDKNDIVQLLEALL